MLKFVVFFLVAQVTASALLADSREEFLALKAEFDARVASSGEDQYKFYLAELEKLERTLVAQRNYASAIAVRDEVDAIKAKIAQFEQAKVTPVISGKIIFLPENAELKGVELNSESKMLHGWSTPDDAARWSLPDLTPGGYEVVLEYSASNLEGGELLVSEEFFNLSGKIAPTEGKTVKLNLGTLKIRSGQSYLTLQATTNEIGGLMHLKSIELIPAWR